VLVVAGSNPASPTIIASASSETPGTHAPLGQNRGPGALVTRDQIGSRKKTVGNREETGVPRVPLARPGGTDGTPDQRRFVYAPQGSALASRPRATALPRSALRCAGARGLRPPLLPGPFLRERQPAPVSVA
jgi:hypothetical protein